MISWFLFVVIPVLRTLFRSLFPFLHHHRCRGPLLWPHPLAGPSRLIRRGRLSLGSVSSPLSPAPFMEYKGHVAAPCPLPCTSPLHMALHHLVADSVLRHDGNGDFIHSCWSRRQGRPAHPGSLPTSPRRCCRMLLRENRRYRFGVGLPRSALGTHGICPSSLAQALCRNTLHLR